MIVIGLTGSIGMGKSTVAGYFSALGVPTFDADAAVHELYAGEAVAAIEAAFPGVTREGRVDRALLGATLVREPARFKDIEAIVHPLVRMKERAFLKTAFSAHAPAALLDIPLLYETGADQRVDVVVTVSATAAVQRQRVLARAGMTPEKLERFLAHQLPDEEKRRRSDFVVDTNGSLSETQVQVARVLVQITSLKPHAYQTFWV